MTGRAMSADCERARQWSSTELDGELSSFEGVLLRAHVDSCPACSEFRASVGGTTEALRAAPLEQLDHRLELGHLRRRRLRLRLAPAAAAVAVTAVALGSILASSAVRPGSVATGGASPVTVSGTELAAMETMNLRTSNALERLDVMRQIKATSRSRSLRGGPVIWKR